KEGKKLSKRDGVTSISDFRRMGYTAEALANYMTLLGWSPPEGMGERFSLSQAADVFGLERVNKAGARFDWDKLNWLNGQVLREQGAAALRDQLLPLWQAAGFEVGGDAAWETELSELLSSSLTLLADGVEQARPFFSMPTLDGAAEAQLELAGAKAGLTALLDGLEDGALSAQQAQALLSEAAAKAGVKKGVIMKTMRAALLGTLQGPDLLTTWLLLHRRGLDHPRIQRCL
ncbi:MAG: glutamate--tRNA ligase family protein, partial [Cyanobacteriota bacterium]